ncbi:MAG: FG-GAP-like repeat-containing protein [Devosia sp.]
MATYSFPQAGQTVTVDENGGLQNIGGELDLNLFAPSASGVILTISGLVAGDSLGFEPATGFSFANGLIKVDGTLVAVATGGEGDDLVIAFVGGALPDDVATVLHQLAFETTSDAPAALRTLSFALTGVDGSPIGDAGDPSFAEALGTDNPFDGIDINGGNAGTTAVAFVDIDGDGDGDRDFFTTSRFDNDIDYWRNDAGDFTLVESAHAFAGGTREAGVFADFDGVGGLDYASFGGTSLVVELNTGSTTAAIFPSTVASFSAGTTVVAVAAGDLDADGDIDIVFASLNQGVIYARNDGSASAPSFTIVAVGDRPWSIASGAENFRPALGDLDGDGDLDMVLAQDNATDTGAILRYFRNEGTAAVPDFVELTGGSNPFGSITLDRQSAPQFEDVDSDGDLDLVVASPTGAVRTFLNSTSTTPATLVVAVTPQNDAPTVTSGASYSVTENGTAVGTAAATDPENNSLSWLLTGADAALFDISSGGAITFKVAPNFEAPADAGGNNVYNISVVASDGSLTDTKAVTVTVTDANEAPAVTSAASYGVAESVAAVGTATVTDADGDVIAFSLTGADAALFNITSGGVITFKTAPNFEAPADVGGNNVYNINVVASDGSLTDSEAVTVTVTNVNEAPAVTSAASHSVAENGRLVGTATGTDPDAGSALSFSLTGADAALFEIDSDGEIRFRADPDFEAPADAGGDNAYDLAVVATDAGGLTGSIAVTVAVTDVAGLSIEGGNGGGGACGLRRSRYDPWQWRQRYTDGPGWTRRAQWRQRQRHGAP